MLNHLRRIQLVRTHQQGSSRVRLGQMVSKAKLSPPSARPGSSLFPHCITNCARRWCKEVEGCHRIFQIRRLLARVQSCPKGAINTVLCRLALHQTITEPSYKITAKSPSTPSSQTLNVTMAIKEHAVWCQSGVRDRRNLGMDSIRTRWIVIAEMAARCGPVEPFDVLTPA